MSTLGAILRAPERVTSPDPYGFAATRLGGVLGAAWAPWPSGAASASGWLEETEVDAARALAADRLLAQMASAGNLERLAQILAEPLGRFRDVAFDVRDGFEIGVAIGAQLDMIGVLLGWAREGFGDTRYRVFLNIVAQLLLGVARADANWTGTSENVLSIARRFVGPSAEPVFLENVPPYHFNLTVPGISYSDGVQLARFIRIAIYAAVLGHLIVTTSTLALWGSAILGVSVPGAGVWGSSAVSVSGASTWGAVVIV